MTITMPAKTAHRIEYLGIPEAKLAASGALRTAREIEQQPRMLERTHALVAGMHERLQQFVAPVTESALARVILAGAGSSAYIGQCLAPVLDKQLAARVDAVPTTDLVSAPDLYLDPRHPLLLVSFGRSGNSPESLAAVDLVEARVPGCRHLVVTCNAEGALARIQVRRSMTLQLPEETHDAGFAMTSSFSCMLYATLAALSPAHALDARIRPMTVATAAVIEDAWPVLRALAGQGHDRVVYLGSGPLQGLAREAALKLGELCNGSVATCFDSPLGFRHGPKTFVTGNTLVIVFVSNDPLTRSYDHDLIDELRRDGVAARVIEVTAQPRPGATDDAIVVPEMAQSDDVDLIWPCVAAAQVFALQASLARGITPDNPNPQGMVNRVVQGVRIHAAA
jgi:tagatose-6-phosphate ketose/aldose isomerase